MIIDLPLEILVEIAEYDDEIWFKFSISIKKFYHYSIQPNVKNKAMKMFNITEHETNKTTWRQHWYNKGENFQRHGRYEEYHIFATNIAYYKNGVLHGKCYEYYENLLMSEGCYKNGGKHGTFICYYKGEPFQIRTISNFKNDLKDGIFQQFNKDGSLLKQCFFKDDGLIKHIRPLNDGELFIT
jgi:antitoxin component YwqK of YwqJK toxin-antitoxin module